MRNDELHGDRVDTTEQWLNDVQASAAESDAAEWLLRLQSASVSRREKEAFLEWMDRDARHVEAFANLFWTSYRASTVPNSRLMNLRELIEQRPTPSPEAVARTESAQRSRIYRIAASIVLVASVCVGLVQFQLINEGTGARSMDARAAFQTPVGENRVVVLEDASHLTLGGRTRIEVSLSESERTVRLHEGEAFFEVAKERARSFKVHAGVVDVTAVGTAFNVKRTGDSAVVTVTEGRVLVTPIAGGANAGPNRGVFLKAGEQTIATSADVGSPIPVDDLASVISWQTGRLSFRQQPLREAVGDVNRYARKPLVLSPEIGDIAVTGTLTINNIGSWVKSLERAFDLIATEEPDRILIRPRGAH